MRAKGSRPPGLAGGRHGRYLPLGNRPGGKHRMDETAIAFELPHERASATHVGPPLDRISVRDYTRQVEIGAFRSERGVTQRIRFNVVVVLLVRLYLLHRWTLSPAL